MGGSWSARGKFQGLKGFPWEMWVKPKPYSPTYITSELEGSPDNIQLWKVVGFLSVKERQLETQSFLKGQCIKFHLQPLTLGSSRGEAEWTGGAWGELGWWLWGGNWGNSCKDHCAASFHTLHFAWQNSPLKVASAWGKAISSSAWRNYSAPPCRA